MDARGGGVAAVSRLLWQTMHARLDGSARLVELARANRGRATSQTGLAERVRFGIEVAAVQMGAAAQWTLFAHPAVAQVQQFIPPRLRAPYAVFIHGIEVWRPLSAVQRRVLRQARLRLSNSSYTARRTEDMHPDVGPIVPCPLALPPERLLSFPGRQAAVPTVLIVARILRAESYKGHDQLLECWPAVTAQVPSARLVVVGEGDDVVRLREKASALGLGPTSVVFTGFVSANELDTWYSEAWVFAMPSRGEGFGLVYLEAMAHGVPCIGSCEDAAGDVIVDGETGYLVEQADTASLAERLGRLLRDPSLCRELGEQGRRRVMGEFSYDQFSHRLEAAIVDAFGPSAWNGAPPKTAPAH